MLSGGLGLALAPVPLLLAALLIYAAPPRLRRWARPAALAAALLTLAILGLAAGVVAGGGRVQASLGPQVGAVTMQLRSDPTGIVLAFAAVGAALLALFDRRLGAAQQTALLVCAAGAVVAVLAADVVTLFAGTEITTLATLTMLGGERRRIGRGAVVAMGVQHLGSLGLLAAAMQLQTAQGTTVFSALSDGAVTAGVAWPWAAAAAIRLLAPGVQPARGVSVPTAAWAATGAIPCGAAMLLRLRLVTGGAPLPLTASLLLAVAGGAAASAGAMLALRHRDAPVVSGRGLAVSAGGGVIALAGVGQDAAGALVAGLVALFLCVSTSAMWERPAWAGRRWMAPAGFLAAGGLPLGFGATAVVLELGRVVSLGRAGTALLVALLLGAAGAAGAALMAAWTAHRIVVEAREPAPALGLAALGAGLVAALVPGSTLGLLTPLLAGEPAAAAGGGSVLSPGGGWAGGYLLAGGLFLAITAVSAAVVAQLRVPRAALRPPEPPRTLPLPIKSRRAAGRSLAAAVWVTARVDEWLTVQPQLPLLVTGGVLALLLIH